MTDRDEIRALASQYGIHRQDGHPSTWEFDYEGLMLFLRRLSAKTMWPDELRDRVRAAIAATGDGLQPARVPEGCLDREYVERTYAKSRNWQGQISVNASVLAELCHTYLAAAPAPEALRVGTAARKTAAHHSPTKEPRHDQ